MGRQHTTWISDETWERLQNIGGDSVSKKIANAVKAHDPDNQMLINAKMRQLEAAKDALRNIAQAMHKLNEGMEQYSGQSIDTINTTMEDIHWFLWEASA